MRHSIVTGLAAFSIFAASIACKSGDTDGADGDEGSPQAAADGGTSAPDAGASKSDAAAPAPDSGVATRGSSPVGGACKTLADCVVGATECNGDPGGQCTLACTGAGQCDAFGAICDDPAASAANPGNCYHKCTTSADCTRPGYGCVGGKAGYKFCDPLHEVGDSCTTAADCAAGLTVCNGDPGGQCTKSGCNTQADCDGLPGGAVCEKDRPGNCYKSCKTKADCPRDGYDCIGGPNAEGKMWCDVVPVDAGTD